MPDTSNIACLGLDIGGTATRWHLLNSGRALSGVTNGASGHVQRAEVQVQIKQALHDIVQHTGPVPVVLAGVTGLSRDSAEAHVLSDMLQRIFEADQVTVMSDIELAHRAAFPLGKGILVYAGTGSIAAHILADGSVLTAGGKGVLIDDAGGGYWIAIRGVRYVLRAEDSKPGSGWASPIGKALATHFSATDWPSVRTHFYALDRGAVGRLATAVKHAANAYDPVAIDIFKEAGYELANLAQMLRERVGDQPITLAGRAGLMHFCILDSMVERLGAVSVVDATEGATAKAAAALARVSIIN